MIFKMNITTKICPKCGSEDVYMVAGGITGGWMCKNCGYIGAILEKEIIGSKNKNVKIEGGKK